MASFVTSTVATGQAVSPTDIYLKTALITSGSGPAVLTIKGAGNTQLVLAVPANDSFEWGIPGGPSQVAHIPGPVTIDLSGTGSFARLDY